MSKEAKRKIDFKDMAAVFAADMTSKNSSAYASSTAFFFFISLIPTLVVLMTLVVPIGVNYDILVERILQLIPTVTSDFVLGLLGEAFSKSQSMLPIFFLLILWSAAMGMMALIRGLNEIYNIKETRNYFYLRFIAAMYTLALLAFIVVMLVFTVVDTKMISYLKNSLPFLQVMSTGAKAIRMLILAGVSILFFALLYTYFPGKKQRYLGQIPGAIFVAVAWWIFSYVFSTLVSRFHGYSMYYGSLATLVVLLFWLYYFMYILLIGAFINSYLAAATGKFIDLRKKRLKGEL